MYDLHEHLLDCVICPGCGGTIDPEYVEFDHNQLVMFPEAETEPFDPYWRTVCGECGYVISEKSEEFPATLGDMCNFGGDAQYQNVNLGAYTKAVFRKIATYVHRTNTRRTS